MPTCATDTFRPPLSKPFHPRLRLNHQQQTQVPYVRGLQQSDSCRPGRGRLRPRRTTTVNGSILSTGNSVTGDLAFVLDPALDVRVALQTRGGEIQNALSDASVEEQRFSPRKSLQFSLGDGKGMIELHSISGDLPLTLP